MREIGHFIGGKHVAGTSGRFADVYNPATGEVESKVALASDAELRAAVENAKAAQPAVSLLPATGGTSALWVLWTALAAVVVGTGVVLVVTRRRRETGTL